MKALVVGEALIDIIDRGGDAAPQEHPGGSPMNVARGLARLGVETTFLTRLGDDARGRLIVDDVTTDRVTIDRASFVPGPTSTARAVIAENGNATYEFDLHWDLDPVALPADVELVHAGSLGALMQPGSDRVVELFDAAHEGCLVGFDPNIRPALSPDHAWTVARADRLARSAHVVKMSDEDAAWLYADLTHDEVLDRCLDGGAAIVAITRGADGVVIASRDERLELPTRVTRVVDTVGAGDAFMSGLLFGVVDSGASPRVRRGDVVPGDLRRVADVALACAGFAVSHAGAQPPTLGELSALLTTA